MSNGKQYQEEENRRRQREKEQEEREERERQERETRIEQLRALQTMFRIRREYDEEMKRHIDQVFNQKK